MRAAMLRRRAGSIKQSGWLLARKRSQKTATMATAATRAVIVASASAAAAAAASRCVETIAAAILVGHVDKQVNRTTRQYNIEHVVPFSLLADYA